MNPALDSRARFEAWHAKANPNASLRRDRADPEDYHMWDTAAAWEAWQAAIASMWLPIETVPTDGSMFLVWFSAFDIREDEDGKPRFVDASTADFAAWRNDPEHGGYVDCFGAPHGDGGGPTHWQPITPPTAVLAAKETT